MVKHGIAALLALPLLCSSFAYAQDAKDYNGNDRGEWHQRLCTERYAKSAARLAYLEAKLNLTEQQKPAWGRWRQAKIEASEKRRSACLQHEPGKDEQQTALDREARIEKALSTRLQDLQASRPALQALYDSLSAEQKVIFDHSQKGHRHHHRGEGARGHWHGFHGEGHERI